jgi:imidazolonepropionase-like amidohydrolase
MPSHRWTSAREVLLALALPAFAVFAPHAALAAEPEPAPAPPAHLALKADRVLDVAHGAIRNQAFVLIEGNKIVGIADTPAPGYMVRDLGDVTLLPGLIDAHTHLMASADDGYEHMLLTMSQARRALEGAGNARRTLMAGFTTVRDVENEGSGYADVDLRDAIEAGVVEGPRMRVATRAIAAVGQYFPFGISPDLVDFPQGRRW